MLFAEQPALPPWFTLLPLLALIGAMAAYVGAIRLWYHKLRMDSVDTVNKELKGEPIAGATDEQKKPFKPALGRYTDAVLWLRGLMVLDVVLLFAAVVVYKQAFQEWLPCNNWVRAHPFDRFAAAIQLGGLAIVLFCIAHVLGGAAAWYRPLTYGGEKSSLQWGISAGAAAVVLAVAIFCC